MEIGKLNKKLMLQRLGAKTPDGGGGYTQAWQDIKQVWANVDPMNPQEVLINQQLKQTTTHTVTVRYSKDFKRGDRFNYGGRFLQIVTMQNVKEESRFLRISCTESW